MRLPFVRVAAWPDGLDAVRSAGFEIAALTPARDAIAIDDFARTAHPRLLIAVGSAGHGLSPAMMRYADVRVRIPMDERSRRPVDRT